MKTITDEPKTHQELFLFAIKQAVIAIGEFGYPDDNRTLRLWARRYARTHGLVAPTESEVYGIYYEEEEEEKEEEST